MTLKVDDLTLTGTVDEIIAFLDKYKENPNRYKLAGVLWNMDGTMASPSDSLDYKARVENFEKDK